MKTKNHSLCCFRQLTSATVMLENVVRTCPAVVSSTVVDIVEVDVGVIVVGLFVVGGSVLPP